MEMETKPSLDTEDFKEIVSFKINEFLRSMKDQKVTELHTMLLAEVEPPLLQAAMEHSKFNQVRAAKTLGMSRGTLRKKLVHYFDDKYCGNRE